MRGNTEFKIVLKSSDFKYVENIRKEAIKSRHNVSRCNVGAVQF